MPLTSHAEFAAALLSPLAEAARVILATRENGLIIEQKANNSPVTEADRQAEAILTAALNHLRPDIPVVAEESSASGSAPDIGATFFLLDPLDGTRDYCAGNDDFTVNIGLIDAGQPVFGLLYAPARSELYVTTGPGQAVSAYFDCIAPCPFTQLAATKLNVRTGRFDHLTALVSRHESGPEFDDRLKTLGVSVRTPMSSAIKFGRLARGEADLYPRFGPTCEWDTAAGQAIVVAAGGTVSALDGSPMIYGKAAQNFLNGPFLVRGRIEPT